MKSLLKTLALVTSMVMAAQAGAHSFKAIKSSKDRDLAATMKVAQAFTNAANKANSGSSSGSTVYKAYSVTEIKPPQGKKESDADLYIRIAKAVMHRDFPITGDDGGYDVKLISKKSELKNLGDIFTQDTDGMADPVKELQTQLQAAIDSGLLVYSATGSGNNTMASVLIVAYPATGELFYVMDSNFGSDN
ncbi:MAG: hypothetical protein ACXVA9_12545 [Bdellovibrionales bacterium]